MMRTSRSDALFDCLYLSQVLQDKSGAFGRYELHIFSYLACLLWLFRNRAVADWGYEFVGTELGAPFAREIDSSLDYLMNGALVVRDGERLRTTGRAAILLQDVVDLELNRDRVECLEAAGACLTAYSMGMVSTALANEPELFRAAINRNSKRLFDESAVDEIYGHFTALKQGLGSRDSDLRVPAVVWLSALLTLDTDGI